MASTKCKMYGGLLKGLKKAAKSHKTPKSLKKGIPKARKTIMRRMQAAHCPIPR